MSGIPKQFEILAKKFQIEHKRSKIITNLISKEMKLLEQIKRNYIKNQKIKSTPVVNNTRKFYIKLLKEHSNYLLNKNQTC